MSYFIVAHVHIESQFQDMDHWMGTGGGIHKVGEKAFKKDEKYRDSIKYSANRMSNLLLTDFGSYIYTCAHTFKVLHLAVICR